MALENGVDTIEHGAAMNDDTIELFKKDWRYFSLHYFSAIPLAKFDPVVSKASEIVLYNSEVLLKESFQEPKNALKMALLWD